MPHVFVLVFRFHTGLVWLCAVITHHLPLSSPGPILSLCRAESAEKLGVKQELSI